MARPDHPLSARGARVSLRALEPSDVPLLYEWENRRELWDAGSTVAPFSLRQLHAYASGYDGDIFASRQLRMMIDLAETGETIGTLDLFNFDPACSRCEVGIFVNVPWQGRGYGAEALSAAASVLGHVISLHQLYAVVCSDNEPAKALFAKAGFRHTATLPDWIRRGGEYADALVFSLFQA
ncbi:MAG: GNAT family N-acetyltransferase [Duncaniella sp.]|nr:GNAT family N-acetyltransferase [Duncaniella sp.]